MLVKNELQVRMHELQSKWNIELLQDKWKTEEFYKMKNNLSVEHLPSLTMITDTSSITALDLLLTLILNLKYSVTKINGITGDEEFISSTLDEEYYKRVYDTFFGCDYLKVNEVLSYMGHFFTRYDEGKRNTLYSSLYHIITLDLLSELKLRCNSLKEAEDVLEDNATKVKLLFWNEIICNDHKKKFYINVI